MIKKWQSHRKYLRFLKHCKTRFDSSARSRWRELRPIRMRLKALNLDPAGEFMQSLYSHTGRPALHQAHPRRWGLITTLLTVSGQPYCPIGTRVIKPSLPTRISLTPKSLKEKEKKRPKRNPTSVVHSARRYSFILMVIGICIQFALPLFCLSPFRFGFYSLSMTNYLLCIGLCTNPLLKP